jgi:hypothetical protein
MNDTINSIGEAASNAANDVLLSKTSSFVNWIKSFMTWENLFKPIGTLLIIFVIWIIFRLIAKAIRKVPEKKLPAQRAAIIIKLIRYVFYVVVFCPFFGASLVDLAFLVLDVPQCVVLFGEAYGVEVIFWLLYVFLQEPFNRFIYDLVEVTFCYHDMPFDAVYS